MYNETEFSQEFAKRLTQKVEGLKIYSIDGLEILTEFESSNKNRHFLHNCYSEYIREPDDIEEIFKKYLNSSISLYKPDETLNINSVLPVIKDKRFIQHLMDLNENFEKNHLYEQYNDELFIFYVQDTDTNINYLTKEDFKTLNVDINELKKVAIKNLSNIIEIEKHGENGYYLLLADGNYESSLILLDIWYKENFEVKGEFIIGIPSRDLLIITGKKDIYNLERLKKTIEEINENGDHLVSKDIFEYKEGKFIKM
ncbi:uncharacterized protein YtpQ (UPF0354 family) [Flavobacterium arsenatis]|uniref:Uncharacterized protein YtpQ (UPF0354 family) n=1 Tax=Flavobacterium arsenatis TaxID=1484332 RepID=A0ABU1TL10_9FLAO|nr:DUF1444 family protein [Flavobacterium arsenatis]MDR6966658.1 uncharacterized protein YtpQ (UPF0354 family) [Flavobacterium arsenatis]